MSNGWSFLWDFWLLLIDIFNWNKQSCQNGGRHPRDVATLPQQRLTKLFIKTHNPINSLKMAPSIFLNSVTFCFTKWFFTSQIDYLVEVNTVIVSQFDPMSNRLVVDLEDKYAGDMWRGDFSAKFVEELTNKTGTFKKFNVFVKMLISALNNQRTDDNNIGSAEPKKGSTAVSVSLLTQ